MILLHPIYKKLNPTNVNIIRQYKVASSRRGIEDIGSRAHLRAASVYLVINHFAVASSRRIFSARLLPTNIDYNTQSEKSILLHL